MSSTTLETLEMIKSAQQEPIAKNWTQSSGLVNYDLERPAKLLYPVITPLRNMIPRLKGNGGTATNWNAITGVNINNVAAGVSEGNRGGLINSTVTSYLATYKGIGLEDYVTFEADYAGEGYDDVRARAVEGLLRATMIAEEKLIIGGNTSVALGTTPTPTLTASTSGGTLATATYSVICVALTADGYYRSTVSGGVAGSITRTNADASSDTFGGGSAQKSANATVAVTGPTGSVSATVATVKGAIAYAWYWGAAASEVLGAITTINSVVITAAAAGTQTAASMPSSDNSTNSLVYDGLISQISKSGSNAYYVSLATGTAGTGSTLTSDGAGGIVEINTALQSFWDNYRLGPSLMLVSSQELKNITKKVIANGGAPLFRFNMDGNGRNADAVTVTAGAIVGSYLNPFAMDGGNLVKVMLHPNVTPGTIILYSENIPYPLSNVQSPLVMRTRQEYYQIEWPRKSRKYEYGVYVDEVLQCYFPPAFGVITNIANG